MEHYVKSVQIRSFFWSVFSCIQFKYRKIGTRKNSVFGHFLRNGIYLLVKVIHSGMQQRNTTNIAINVGII